MAKSNNGFTFTTAVDATGTEITVVASKDDHEGKRTEVFTFTTNEAYQLRDILDRANAYARDRRKAIRKAIVESRTAHKEG